MKQEEIQKRVAYIDAKMDLMKQLHECEVEEKRARLQIIDSQNKIIDIEGKVSQLVNDFIDREEAPTWHPASEVPQDKDAWYVAIFHDVPIITHYLYNGWLPGVTWWQKLNIPTNE